MKKIIVNVLLTLFPTILFATTAYSDPKAFVTNFPIFVNGDVQSIENSFKFIKILLSDSSFVNNILTLMSFILTSLAGWRIYKTQALSGGVINAMYLTAGVLSLTGALPVDVHIEDQRTQIDYAKYGGINYAKVEDIPFPIAALISASSTLTLSIVEKVEQATVDVDSDQVSAQAIGFASAFSDVTKIINYAKYSSDVTDSVFEQVLVEYISTCILDKAYYSGTAQKDIIRKVRNPQKDIFKELNSTSLGISNEPITFTDSSGNSYGTCGDLYNYLSTNYTKVADDTLALLDKALTGSGVYLDMSKVTNAKITDSMISGELGQFKAYVMNVAAVGPISRAIRNSSGSTVSGQDLANSITLEATKAKLQSEGAGQFRWMAEILPMGYHFMLGIIYSCSVFVMIVSIAMGYEKGFALMSNYAQGLLSFEFIKVGLEMANNSVNQYSKSHAADVLSALGSNPASIENLPYHLEYIASMTGLAGILGVGAIFIIPTIVFTGKVAVAAGALSGLGNQYRGNNIETATNTVSGQRAKEEAYNESLRMSHALEKAGYDVPANMGAGDYYAQMQKDVSESSKALSLATMGSGAIMNVGKADGMTEMSNVSTKETLANSTTSLQHIASGSAAGATQAGAVTGSAEFVGDMGIEGLAKGSKVQSLKEKYGQDASGKTMTDLQASQVGTSLSSFQNAQDIELVESRKNAELLNNDYMASDLSKKSMKNRFAKESSEYAGVGKATLTNNDLDNFETQGRGKFEETAIGAKAYTDKATKDGVLTEGYKDAVYGSEGAKIGAMIATTEAMGGSQNQINFAEASSTVKTAEDVSGFKSKLQEAGLTKEDAENFGKNAGEAFNKAVEKLAGVTDAKVGAQTRSDIETIASAGGNEGYKSTVARMSAAQMGANIATMNEADSLGGYENFLNMSAREKIGTGIESLAGKKDAGMINESGSLTDVGRATVKGSSYLDSKKSMGNVKSMMNVMHDNPQYVESFVYNSLEQSSKVSEETRKNVESDFIKSGLISKDDSGQIKVNAENFAEAKAYLNANNMNSHNALVAGGMVFSGALGEKSSVQATALNSVSHGSKGDFYNEQQTLNNSDPLTTLALERFNGDLQKASNWARSADGAKWAMDPRNELSLVAAETVNQVVPESKQGEHGEIAAVLAGGLGAGGLGLYTLNKMTKKPIKVDTDKYNKITDENGNIQGYEDEKGNKVADKSGFKVNDHGEKVKSGVVGRTGSAFASKMAEYKDNLSSGKNTNKASPTSFTTEDKTKNPISEHNSNEPNDSTSDHNNSSNKDNNGSITQNKESLNSKTKENINKALDEHSKLNEQSALDGKITPDEYAKKDGELDKLRKDVEKGKIHSKALSNVGIKAQDLGLDISDKGFVDIEASDKKIADFETKRDSMIASMELKGEDATLLKEQNGLIRNNDSIQEDLNENQKKIENNAKLKDSISQAEGFKSKFESGGTFTKNDLTGVNGFKEQTVLGDMNQNINSVKDAISNTTDAQEISRLQNNLEELQSIKEKFTSGGNITKQELMDSTGMKKDDILSRVNDHIESAKGQFANTMTPDRVEGLQNQMKANDLVDKGFVDSIHTSTATSSVPENTHSVNIPEVHAPKAPGVVGGMLSLLGMTVLADQALGSVTGNQDTIANNVGKGNYSSAAMKTVEAVDPWIALASTVKEQSSKASDNFEQGNYASGIGDIAYTPIAFSKNLVSQGFDTGKSLHGMYDGWQNGKSAMDSVDTNAFSNELKSQIKTIGEENNYSLMSNGNTMHLNSIGGTIDIGQNNDRMMRINGMQTQIPYDDFQQQIQSDTNLRNNFSSLISGSDMSSGGKIDNSITTMDSLMDQFNQKFNTQEMMAMGQIKNINTMSSHSSEILERTEEMFDQFEEIQDKIQSLEKMN